MLSTRLLILPLLGLVLLAGEAIASGSETSGPDAAIRSAAVAPYRDSLAHDPAALCADLTPSVAADLVEGVAPALGCVAAASRDFAISAPSEPHAEAGLSLKPTVQHLQVAGQRASVELRLVFVTVTEKSRTTQAVIIHAVGPIKLDLEEVGGTWLVSSPARLTTVPGCHLPKPRRCLPGARVLSFFVGEPVPPGQELPTPAAVKRAGGREQRGFEAGKLAVVASGCLACHRIGDSGNKGPGPSLTHIGSRLSESQIARAIVNPRAPMPSFRALPHKKFRDIVRFLALLR